MRIMPSETQKHTHCPSIFFFLLGKYITESFRYQYIQISFILFHICQEFHYMEVLQFIWFLSYQEGFPALGHYKQSYRFNDNKQNTEYLALCIMHCSKHFIGSLIPFIMVTVFWGTYHCHFTDKEQHSGYLPQVTKKMTKQALSPSLTQSPHPSWIP